MATNNESKFLKQFGQEFNLYVMKNHLRNLNTKEGLTHAMNQFLIEKMGIPKELEEVFMLFIFPGIPVSRWAYKYRILPYINKYLFPELDIQMLYADDARHAHMKGLIEQLLPIMERQKEELAFMPEDEQEWIETMGPDYRMI